MQGLWECQQRKGRARQRHILVVAIVVLVALSWAQAQVQSDNDLVFEDELIASEHNSEIVKRAAPAALDAGESFRPRRRGTRLVSKKGSKKKTNSNIDALFKSKRSNIRSRQTDDDDYSDVDGSGDVEGSGDLTPITPTVPPSGRKFYRCSVVIQEPFDESLQDRNSPQFEILEESFSKAVAQLYNSLPGTRIVTVQQFSKYSNNQFTKVSFDLGSEGYLDDTVLELTLKNAVQSGNVGSFIVKEEGFQWRPVQGPSAPVVCSGDETPCRDGNGCYKPEDRCNDIDECEDGTDEEDCGLSIPVPTQGPVVDECRGDDKFRCKDGTQIICKVQECDGVYNCRDGSDEIDCPTPTCEEFLCDRTRCIPKTKVCDRVRDCDDGTDENDCKPVCTADSYQCSDSSCIPLSQFCDGNPDCSQGEDESSCQGICSGFECGDGSCVAASKKCDGRGDCPDFTDETTCQIEEPCGFGEFQCRDGSCVPSSRRCNGVNDCRDGSDESGCRCRPGQWQCNDGTCIDQQLKCDGKKDCPAWDDRSDEEDCPTTTTSTTTTTVSPVIPSCSENQYQCADGQCIDQKYYCDSIPDCIDGSDEKDCKEEACRNDQFRCADGKCIDLLKQCDGTNDCSDASDELNCPTGSEPTRCQENEFECLGGGCVEDSLRCDGFRDCPDGSDEAECGCRADQFQCQEGSCIDSRRKCDGYNDCSDASDEANCITACRLDQFRCNTGECIDDSRRCDRVVDCPDRSDELNCPAICRGGEFSCASGNQCIRENQVCDGRPDCADYSDESNCPPAPEGGLNLKTYPNEQTILQGREVVFQCRDEGPLRTAVRWVRGSGQSLPAGSRDNNGRLEMPNIQPEHAGTYICEAVGYPSTTPGARVSVYLQVTPFVEPTARPPTACGINEATCMNGECIPKSSVCDGRFDCSDQSDEMRCSLGGCEPNEYQCENKRCVLKTWRCDGDDDCGDNSDEKYCQPSTPGSSCRYDEFQCASKNQCIPKSFHCDMEIDCQDRSDEIGCSKPTILIPPPPSMMVNVGDTFTMNCTAYGVPTPEVVWRLNWGHVPPKCTMTSVNGYGVLTCPNAELTDQGAYSCEAINAKGSTFAIPDLILTVKTEGCSRGSFGQGECISCFCFGHTDDCRSSSLYVSQLRPPTDQFQLITLRRDVAQGRAAFATTSELELSATQNRGFLRTTSTNDGAQVFRRAAASRDVSFFNLPSSHRGNQLKSYGGYIRYQLLFRGSGSLIRVPDVILSGNGLTIYHESRASLEVNRVTSMSVRFWYGQWYKRTSGRPGGDIAIGSDQLATREEIMMVLQNIDHFLLRASYLDGPTLDTTISQILMDTGVEQYTNQGGAVFIEECRCPPGYIGLSCEECAPGYVREQTGSWLGRCVPQPTSVCNPQGTLTSSGTNCVCKPGVTGARCDQCKANYFNLGGSEEQGCTNCFCLGITQSCTSSSWYRQQERAIFTSDTQGFALTDKSETITDRISVNLVNREIVYRDFSRLSPDVHYWKLPPKFLGDKVTSYGGRLNYTVRYVPVPGGRNSPNTAPDIELSGNRIKLFYFRSEPVESSRANFVSVPIVENVWQRQDGQKANREHLLMALADLDYIYIKATYTTGTQEAALSEVTLDIAEERYTGQARAVEVEQCSCPPGYKGLSCEDCDTGYTHSLQGVYLGLCEPCACHGHSSECHPETGICLNCRDHTTGDACDECEPGYEGDATSGTPYDCRPVGPGCNCDPRGSARPDCRDDRTCTCKANVEGPNCDQCREGTFALSQQNPQGCLGCFCSGVTNQCSAARLFRTQIPMQILDSQHGFTINDRSGPINANLGVNIGQNELSYNYPTSGQSQRLYWSLPSMFTGNKVTSYGGKLSITQKYEERAAPFAQKFTDNDVILTGNGISLGFVNPEQILPGRTVSYTVPLREAGWRRLDRGAAVSGTVTREDMMVVLSNLASIQIRATFGANMAATYLSNVVMDTAVPQSTGQEHAADVEECRCPQGYRGTSCEQCEVGYYRDYSSSRYGVCRRCPCNNREESCSASEGRGVTCVCKRGYAGQFCEQEGVQTPPPPPAPTIELSVTDPRIQVAEVGSTVKFHCRGQSLIGKQVSLSWSKEGGVLPVGRARDDRLGVLIITDVRASDSGTYICSAVDGISIVTETAVLSVGESGSKAPQVFVDSRSVTAYVGQSVQVKCSAEGSPRPQILWQNARGLPVGSDVASPDGLFRIAAVRKSDEGEYTCVATNAAGTHSARIVIYVSDTPRPAPTVQVLITPQEAVARRGDSVSLTCRADVRDAGDRFQSVPIIRWTRIEGPLPVNSVQAGGVLTIPSASPADSGIYICTVTIASGAVQQSQARVNILAYRGPPTVRVEPDRQTVAQGTSAELRCQATGDPLPTIRWSKVGEDFTSNVQVNGPVLRIVNALVQDRGMYICIAENAGGTAQASAIIEVERREPPAIELYPQNRQTVISGGSALFQCRVTAGIPVPSVKWSRADQRPLPSTAEELEGGVIRFSRVTGTEQGQYICTASSDAGTITAIASLEIQSVPVITINPGGSSLRVRIGQRLRLECRSSGSPAPSVSWRRLRTGFLFDSLDTGAREIQQLAVYEVSRVTQADEGTYSCTARNEAGVTEERIQVIVEPQRGDIEENDVETGTSGSQIRVDNVPATAVGGKIELRCLLDGPKDGIHLEWVRSDGREMPADYDIRGGVLTIRNVQPSAAGEYSCIGVGPDGSTLFTAATRFQVVAPPRITLNPQRQVVRPGDFVTIECSATGDQPITINWSKQNGVLPSSVVINGGVIQFRGIAVSDAGLYVCTAANSVAEATSLAEVAVNEDRSVSSNQREKTVATGSNIKLSCSDAARGPGVRTSWSRDRGAIPRSALVNRGELELINVQPSDAGRYICRMIGPGGSSEEYILLSVQSSPNLAIRVLPSLETVRRGDNLDVRCEVSGDPSAIVSWKRLGAPMSRNVQTLGNVLRVTDVRPENGGVYSCQVLSSAGAYEEKYVLSIQAEPDFALDAATVETHTAPVQTEAVVMECRTNLRGPVTYSWSRQGGTLPKGARVEDSKLTLVKVRAEDAGTYICTARNNVETIDIPTVLVVTGVVPYFAQAPLSYMELPTLSDAYYQFDIEISFKPESPDGLILYNGQQSGGSGDFVSFGLSGGHAEFRFDMGAGPAVIRSTKTLELGKWHTVKLSRNRKDGTMIVDDEGTFFGSASGRSEGLDLLESLYIGGVPNFRNIQKQAGFSRGFVGCISRVVIGSTSQELVRDAKSSRGITTCETCALNPCENGGVCQEAHTEQGYSCICPAGFSGPSCDRVGEACYPGACGSGKCVNVLGGFECFCPFGKSGSRCEKDIVIYEPAFSDGAYVAYPSPPKTVLRRMKMSMRFKPRQIKDGLLMYCAQTETGQGDFTSLAIKDRRLEFRFDSGSGTAILRSDREIRPGEWITVSTDRNFKEGTMSVNGGPQIRGRSPGSARGLNLHTKLFVGGWDKHGVRLSNGVNVTSGFDGCISSVEVAGMELDMVNSVIDSSNVEDCGGQSPCDRKPCLNNGLCTDTGHGVNDFVCQCEDGFRGKTCEIEEDLCLVLKPCQNGGTCVGTANNYKCNCPLGYGATNCETKVDLGEEVSFKGDGYAELNRSLLHRSPATTRETIVLEFTTTKANGILFWHGQAPETDGKGLDFVALAVVDGRLEFSYELGSGPAQITTPIRVDDGQRHRVVARRTARNGSLELDDIYKEHGLSLGVLQSLNTKGNIFIGGLPSADRMTAGRYLHGFSGCIHSLRVQESGNVNYQRQAVSAVNALPCSSDDIQIQQNYIDEDEEDPPAN